MFFPSKLWWDTCEWEVPDGVKYLCERWWELLRDWRNITVFSLQTSFVLSVLEDFGDVVEDLQAGRIKTTHQLDALKDELSELLVQDSILRNAFQAETRSLQKRIDELYDNLPSSPQDKYSELKKRKVPCRLAAASARRLHHRCMRRRTSQHDMTWSGFGGLVESELIKEVQSQTPDYAKINRLTSAFLMDSLYRGYDSQYLATLFDRYLPDESDVHDGLLHVFRRLHSLLRHEYDIFFLLNGASAVTSSPEGVSIDAVAVESLAAYEFDAKDQSIFLAQKRAGASVVLRIPWNEAPDAGAAAVGARKKLQEIVDYLDFESPVQDFEIGAMALIAWSDKDGKRFSRVYPDSQTEPPSTNHRVEITYESSAHVTEIAEALRWSAVARRETSPEVSLLASWFAFEFLGGTLERTPVEGIMEYFPKTLAIGNLTRRLVYWWKTISTHRAFDSHQYALDAKSKATRHGGSYNLEGIFELLIESISEGSTSNAALAVRDTSNSSILLRERTRSEAKLFRNNQMIAQTLSTDVKEIRRELQQFLVIRNKLVHRARIDHPLLPVVSRRASDRLYDLLRDLSTQLSKTRIDNSVSEVFRDFRDTYDEIQEDLGSNQIVGPAIINRITLS